MIDMQASSFDRIRYKAINQVMMQYEATQILEIASGFLPRGMALSQNPEGFEGRGESNGQLPIAL